jgi:hypothetical protein
MTEQYIRHSNPISNIIIPSQIQPKPDSATHTTNSTNAYNITIKRAENTTQKSHEKLSPKANLCKMSATRNTFKQTQPEAAMVESIVVYNI